MLIRAVVVIAAAAPVGVAAIGAVPGESAPTDIPQLVDALSARRASLSSFDASGYHFRTLIDHSSATGLLALATLPSWTRGSASGLLEALAASVPDRECFKYKLLARSDALYVERDRISGLDTLAAVLSSKLTAEQSLHPPAASEILFIAGSQSWVIRDHYFVSKLGQDTRDAVMGRLDFTLADWTLAKGPSTIVGQEQSITPSDENPGWSVLQYSTPATTGWARYVIDPSNGQRPVRLTAGRGDAEQMRVVYSYPADEAVGLPLVSASMRQVGDLWSVEVVILEQAIVSPSLPPLAIRVPAIRLDLDDPGTGGDLALSRVLPAAVEAAVPPARLAIAVSLVLEHWGSDEASVDFDGDGVVGPGDLARAEEVL